MQVEFIEGNFSQSYFIFNKRNEIILNGTLESNTDKMILGNLKIEWDRNENGKIKYRKKVIRMVRQEKWYLYIPTFIHEFCHYLIYLITPCNGRIHPMHELVEKYINLNKIFK